MGLIWPWVISTKSMEFQHTTILIMVSNISTIPPATVPCLTMASHYSAKNHRLLTTVPYEKDMYLTQEWGPLPGNQRVVAPQGQGVFIPRWYGLYLLALRCLLTYDRLNSRLAGNSKSKHFYLHLRFMPNLKIRIPTYLPISLQISLFHFLSTSQLLHMTSCITNQPQPGANGNGNGYQRMVKDSLGFSTLVYLD